MLGALLGTQNGREVEIVNTFELAVEDGREDMVDHGFLAQRRDQCTFHTTGGSSASHLGLDKQVFPSLEFIGWYTVAPMPTSRHIALQDQVRSNCSALSPDSCLISAQFTGYCSTPLLLLLQPSSTVSISSDITGQTLPFRAYEPSVEIRDKKTRSVFIEAPFKVETGEAERIAVDWTAKGGGGSTSRKNLAAYALHNTMLMLLSGIPFASTKGCSQDAS